MEQSIFVIIAFLSALFVQLANMNNLNRKFIENDQCFRKDKYWRAEKFSIFGTIVFIMIFCLAFPEAVIEYKISRLIQFFSYALAGGVGSVIFSYWLGRSEKFLKRQIDNKMGDDPPNFSTPAAPKDEELKNG